MKKLGVVLGLALVGLAGAQPSSNAENGKRLFLRNGCYQCHGYSGQGGSAGARIGATALNFQAFSRYVRRPTGQMPAYTEKVMTEQEAGDIYAYLKSMPAPKGAKDIPLLSQIKGQ